MIAGHIKLSSLCKTFPGGQVVAVLSVALVLGMRFALERTGGTPFPWMFFPAAVAVSTYFGGWRAGVTALVGGCLVADYFLLEPRGAFLPQNGPELIGTLGGLVAGAILIVAIEKALQLRRKGEKYTRELETLKEDLEATNKRLTMTLERIADAYFVFGPDMVVLELNATAARLYGKRVEELRGKRMLEVFPEAKDSEFARRLRQALEDNKEVHIESKSPVIHKWFEAHGFPRDGTIEVFFRDISERKNAEEETNRTRAKLEEILENTNDGFFEFDIEWRIRQVNGPVLRSLKIAREELIGRNVWEKFPHLAGTDLENNYRKAVAENRPVHFQYHVARANMWYAISAIPFREGMWSVAQNITEAKLAEESAAKVQARLVEVLESLQDGFMTIDPHWRVTYVNDRMAEYAMLPKEELMGRDFWETYAGFKGTSVEVNFRRALEERVWVQFEFEGVRQPKWFEINLYPSAEGISVFVHDITERKSAEEALHVTKERMHRHAEELEKTVTERTNRLQEKIGELEAFSYSVSHDLRSPLRALQGYSQALLEDYTKHLDECGVDYLQRIARAGKRLDRLTQDLLTYSRIGRAEIEMVPVDPVRLIPEIIDQYPSLQEPGATVVVEGPLLMVVGHEASLVQCISNLLVNAVKFMSPDRKPEIKIRAESIGEHVRIFFEDNGIGIAPEHQKRIFGMFERIHPNKLYEGTGIGLAIVRKAVERMGGEVGVESVVGEGSKFWIQLKKA